jgi:hypothetical protein
MFQCFRIALPVLTNAKLLTMIKYYSMIFPLPPGEELGANSTDVVDTLTNTSKQGITLTVVGAVMVFDVGVSSLQIAEAEDCVDVGILLEGLESCNLFRTNNNNKPTITIIHQCIG